MIMLPLALAAALSSSPAVQVDQLGYAPTDKKWAAIPHAASQARIRNVVGGAIVLTVPVAARRVVDPASGDSVYSADFTSLVTPGNYYVEVPGVGSSEGFRVDALAYDRLFRKLLKGLYYQRCGTAIPAAYGGAWTHGSCHDHGGADASYDWSTTGGVAGGFRDTRGGWHDAGDYGKYSDNNSYAVGELLQAYLAAPSRFAADDVGIPESHNGVPDLLDEARVGLAWMLKMQLVDGSVLHRESVSGYAGEFLPESDVQTRYYTEISSDATAVQCAAMALGARAYAGTDTTFAGRCNRSALSAWNWLKAHPARVPAGGFANKYGHIGATYIAGSEIGRRLWAAAEMFRLNGDATANSYVGAHWSGVAEYNGVYYPDSWGDVANRGAYAYRTAPGADPALVSGNWWSAVNSLQNSCDNWMARINSDGYGCAASTDPPYGDYYWGATGVFLHYGWAMVEGWRATGNAAYLDAAREQVHYILGRNALGKVFVTGLGSHPVLHAHGAWNYSAGYTNVDDALSHPVPYLLIGGPNKADNSTISPFPGRCYEDIADPNYGYKGNYTLNETSLDIQAGFIALAGFLSTGAATVDAPEPLPGMAHGRTRLTASPIPFVSRVRLQSLDSEGRPAQEADAKARPPIGVFAASGRRVAELKTGVDGSAWWDGRNLKPKFPWEILIWNTRNR